MHGDFEAQRHWMEITTQLPITQWYFHDLEWWGLDYPPLTAFHSWLLGIIGSAWNSDWFALFTSRGLDDPDLKSYMRATAIFSELAVYIPAVIWFMRWSSKARPIDQATVASAILFQPALMLIDHGHFQYNSVMLGFALFTIVNLLYRNYMASAFMFVCALCFKQMALYYAPVVFAHLLGQCFHRTTNGRLPQFNIMRFASIGTVTAVTFVAMLAPFVLTGGVPQLRQIAFRVFPFARGLWEDKVANAWCSLNVVIKLREVFEPSQLPLLALGATLVAILPPMAVAFFKGNPQLLAWEFSACAWGFFLFSFQVHEKSVLLPLMPATLMLSSQDPDVVSLVIWINNIATFSLRPLLMREGLGLQYYAATLLWNWLLGYASPKSGARLLPSNWFWKIVVLGSYAGAAALVVAEHVIQDSAWLARYPDLWVVGNVLLCFPCFALYWLHTLYMLFATAHAAHD